MLSKVLTISGAALYWGKGSSWQVQMQSRWPRSSDWREHLSPSGSSKEAEIGFSWPRLGYVLTANQSLLSLVGQTWVTSALLNDYALTGQSYLME